MNETFNGILNQLLGLSPPALGILALLVLNVLMRRMPQIPNWVIPVLTVAIGTPLFAWLLTLVAATKANPFGLNLLYGFVVSGGVVCCYAAIVLFAESKWPWLASVINGPVDSKKDSVSKAEQIQNDTYKTP